MLNFDIILIENIYKEKKVVSYNKILGFPLLLIDEGRKSGIINEMVFDIENGIVQGLINIGIGRKQNFIKLSDIKLLEDKAVIQDSGSMKAWDKRKKDNKRFIFGKELITKKVFDYNGNDLGYVCDLFMDFDTGYLEAFQLTDGIIEDIIEGRKIIPVFGKIVLKEEGLFVAKESIEEFVDVKKGIKQIFSTYEDVTNKNLQRSGLR